MSLEGAIPWESHTCAYTAKRAVFTSFVCCLALYKNTVNCGDPFEQETLATRADLWQRSACSSKGFLWHNVNPHSTTSTQDRFGRFLAELDRHPGRKRAFLDILGRTSNLAGALSGCVHPHTQTLQLRDPEEVVSALPSLPSLPPISVAPSLPALHHSPVPKNPIRLLEALQRFKDNALTNRTTDERTVGDRDKLLSAFGKYLVGIDPRLSKDLWVHEIATHHLTRFLDASALRSGRREVKQAPATGVTEHANEGTTAAAGTLKPATMLKRLSDLNSFFTWAYNELQATVENPVTGLEGRRRKLTKQANDEAEQYLPFESHHITDVFKPEPLPD